MTRLHRSRAGLTTVSPVAKIDVMPPVYPSTMTSAPATKPVPEISTFVSVAPRTADAGEIPVTVVVAAVVMVKASSLETQLPPGFRTQTV